MFLPQFMKRVEDDGDWSLMCPNESPGLHECYGKEFENLYERYEREGKFKKQVNYKHDVVILITCPQTFCAFSSGQGSGTLVCHY